MLPRVLELLRDAPSTEVRQSLASVFGDHCDGVALWEWLPWVSQLLHALKGREGTASPGAAQVQHEDRFLIGDRLVLAQQVSLEAYHDALGGSSAEAIEEAELVDESEIRAEDTLVAIPHEFTDTGHAQGAQEELSPGLLDEDDAPPASGELEQLPASVQAVAEDAPSPAAEAADAHPVDGDHAPADEDLITQIDEDPGEWARAALSDFQDLDD